MERPADRDEHYFAELPGGGVGFFDPSGNLAFTNVAPQQEQEMIESVAGDAPPPPQQTSGPGAAQLPLMDPSRHLPMGAEPARTHSDGTHIPAQVVTLDVDKTVADIRTARRKSDYFSHSCYAYGAIGTVMHAVVLFCFLFAGSVTFGAVYVVTLLLELTVMSAVTLRASPGGLRILSFASLICWTFIGVVLTLAVTGSITNWMHFEKQWARWLAIGLTYAHVLVCFGMASCIANIMQAKMIISLRASQVSAARIQHAGPETPVDESKIKNT